MLELFRKILFLEKKNEEQDDFADFFLRAKSRDKKKVFKRVISRASQDQKEYLEVYRDSCVKHKA